MDEKVDVLVPPLFKPSGEIKTRGEAYRDGGWIGTFNLWIITTNPEPAIIYQQRSPNKSWAPSKLDVTAGGHLMAGEKLTDGLREVEEELGKRYAPEEITSIGRKLFVDINPDGTSHNNIIDLYMKEDDCPLESYRLDEEEVYAICACPVAELLRVHREPGYQFAVEALTATGEQVKVTVTKDLFPENWDDYHHKIALLAERYFRGERDLIY